MSTVGEVINVVCEEEKAKLARARQDIFNIYIDRALEGDMAARCALARKHFTYIYRNGKELYI